MSDHGRVALDRRHPDRQVLQPDGRRMLTLREAAAHLNCSIDVVRKLIAAGVLRSVRYSQRIQRVPEASLWALLER